MAERDPTASRPVTRVAVIGAGTMGGGIAMCFASAGVPVRLVDTSPQALERGLSVIRRNYEASASRGKLTQADVEARTARITGTLALEDIADCDLVIEAVFEKMEVKQEIFRRLDRVADAQAILATNTSFLDIDAIASATSRPDSVLGLHFFSPAHIMRLLEIVRGAKTDPSVLATALDVARTIGKVAVVVGNGHGFVGNRMLAARNAQADALVSDGAMPWDVDRALEDFGFRMGPFAMRDLAGLDVGWSRDASRPPTVRDLLNEAGRLGQKSGGGFYDYDENRARTPSPFAERAVFEISEKQGVVRRAIPDEDILDRCLLAMVNEGARILEEGIAQSASDIDAVWIHGYAWPAASGGPMSWADQQGTPRLLEKLRTLEGTCGPAFRPADLIVRLAAAGQRISDI